ncbi:MAG TPA: type II toxin-antitoxin system RelE/ParE family toxin [Candidatus Acidoferrum sp.]|jgi:toxin ParE1/3/4|nr:type II toxin-antitoxin system RelE/ParE family toxin [Candidatus Acidoferrum sp.]
MVTRIKWLKKALQNFDEEVAYIANDDPSAARLVARRITEAVSLLATQPAIGRPGRVSGTRELLVPKTRYLIPYRVRRGVVEILRVFHASRRPPNR